MAEPTWVIMPILANPELTRIAIASVLAQTVPVHLLLVNQGVDDDFRDELERIAEEYADRVLIWSHQPPLPSLAATWNRALLAGWQSGATEALVVNNDVELHPYTIVTLREVLTREQALFVSAIGVTADEFRATPNLQNLGIIEKLIDTGAIAHGGPDFSCFLISRECHLRFQFDEHFTPAFCEDLDYHRRLMLAGEGKRIFSVNLPYLHHSSQTLKSVDPKERARIERAIEQGSRVYYLKKWGGPVNGETYTLPFNYPKITRLDGDVTTPAIQRAVQEGHDGAWVADTQWYGGQGCYHPLLQETSHD